MSEAFRDPEMGYGFRDKRLAGRKRKLEVMPGSERLAGDRPDAMMR